MAPQSLNGIELNPGYNAGLTVFLLLAVVGAPLLSLSLFLFFLSSPLPLSSPLQLGKWESEREGGRKG